MLDGTRLKKYRQQAQLTLEQLAGACSLPVDLLKKVEEGKVKLAAEPALTVMQVLKIPDRELSQETWQSEVTFHLGDKVRIRWSAG